jgi:hypothetical protein
MGGPKAGAVLSQGNVRSFALAKLAGIGLFGAGAGVSAADNDGLGFTIDSVAQYAQAFTVVPGGAGILAGYVSNTASVLGVALSGVDCIAGR